MTSTDTPATVVVVGASLGGLRAVEQLRAQGFTGRLIVVGDEPWMPYNRPPLSKEALRERADGSVEELAAALAFRPRPVVHDVQWRLGTKAVAADLARRTIGLDDGTELRFDGLVVATGLRPRHLPAEHPRGGRHTVRTVADAVALRRDVRPGTRVVVVGGGFIGCETAATLQTLGAQVTVVEPLPVPMMRGVGEQVGAALLAHHRQAGVQFEIGLGVTELLAGGEDGDRVTGVRLDDGRELPADVLVESVGSHANVEWLAGNGLELSDGVRCDHGLRVEGRRDVVAVGDVARFANPRFDDVPRRVEHWAIPAETAKHAAGSLLGHLGGGAPRHGDQPFAPLPSFWSDQFGLRLQSFGAPGLAEELEVAEGALDDLTGGVAVLYRRAGRVVGVLAIDLPPARQLTYRSLVADARVTDQLARPA